jgi:hypothetical protein
MVIPLIIEGQQSGHQHQYYHDLEKVHPIGWMGYFQADPKVQSQTEETNSIVQVALDRIKRITVSSEEGEVESRIISMEAKDLHYKDLFTISTKELTALQRCLSRWLKLII